MIVTMFYFFVASAFALLVLGIFTEEPSMVVLSSVLFTIIGALFLSQAEVIEEYRGAVVTEISPTIDHIDNNYLNRLATLDNVNGRDMTLWTFSMLFVLGSPILLLFTFKQHILNWIGIKKISDDVEEVVEEP